MHTSLRVTGVLTGLESSVLLGLGFGGRDAAQSVHEPAVVVPADPLRGHVLQVGLGTDGTSTKRGARAYAFGFVEPDRGFAQRIVQGVADGTDRRDQSLQHQCFSVMYCGVLTSGVAMMNRVVERMTLTGTEGRRVTQCALHEAGVFCHRAFPAGDQSGIGVDNKRGAAEPAGVERDVGEVSYVQQVGCGNAPPPAHQVWRSACGRVALGGTRRARMTPRQPLCRMIRSTVRRATGMPWRCICAHIFRLPYRLSGGRFPSASGS